MEVRTKSVALLREMWYGNQEIRLAYIREPERDEKGRVVRRENGALMFQPTSRLRTKMLLRYLREDIVLDVPMALVEDIKEGFMKFADSCPAQLRRSVRFRAIYSDVMGTLYDLGSPEGRLRQTQVYLEGYRMLRSYEKSWLHKTKVNAETANAS